MDPDVFDLVYEGFWDLYTLKPKINVSAKKLKDEWIKKIKLIAGEQKAAEEPAADAKDAEKAEEGEEEKPAEEGEEAKEEAKPKASKWTPKLCNAALVVSRRGLY